MLKESVSWMNDSWNYFIRLPVLPATFHFNDPNIWISRDRKLKCDKLKSAKPSWQEVERGWNYTFKLFFSPKMKACAHKPLSAVMPSALYWKADACSSCRKRPVQITFKYHSKSLISHPECEGPPVYRLKNVSNQWFGHFTSLITDCHSPSLLVFLFIQFEVDRLREEILFIFDMSSFVEGARFVIQWDTTRNRKLTQDLWMQKSSGFMSQRCNAAPWKTREVVIRPGFCSINNATLIYIQLSDYQRPTSSKSVIWLTVIGLSLQPCFQLCFHVWGYWWGEETFIIQSKCIQEIYAHHRQDPSLPSWTFRICNSAQTIDGLISQLSKKPSARPPWLMSRWGRRHLHHCERWGKQSSLFSQFQTKPCQCK